MKIKPTWQDNIKSELEEIGWQGDMGWTNLAQRGEKM
jgi:hypothetical protein